MGADWPSAIKRKITHKRVVSRHWTSGHIWAFIPEKRKRMVRLTPASGSFQGGTRRAWCRRKQAWRTNSHLEVQKSESGEAKLAKIGVRPGERKESKTSSQDLQRASLESLVEGWSIRVGGRYLKSQIRASGKQHDQQCLELTQSWEDRLYNGESRKRPKQMWSSDF